MPEVLEIGPLTQKELEIWATAHLDYKFKQSRAIYCPLRDGSYAVLGIDANGQFISNGTGALILSNQ